MVEEEKEFFCPYCMTRQSVLVDLSGGRTQRFYQDCEICCRPIDIRLTVGAEGLESLEALTEEGD